MNNLPRMTRENCGRELTKKEMRETQLNMLRALATFCDEHGLQYFLSSGTLLGAIRHQGFIPWDDDIDINMPRPDCEKLMSLTGGRLEEYWIVGPDIDGYCSCCESYRIYDPRAVIENWAGGSAKEPSYIPVFADLFPIEGLPTENRKTICHYAKVVFARKMQRVSSLKHMEGSNAAAHLFHAAAWIPAKLVGYTNWSRLVQKIATKYAFDDCEYVGVMTTPFQTTAERVRKEDYLKAIPVQFEGETYRGPGNYDTYLTQLYGDYMTPPPVEKRRSGHVFHMYWNRLWPSYSEIVDQEA